MKVIGLTSPGNVAFTRSLGCYDEVLSYDDVPVALADEPTVYVDFSGNTAVRRCSRAARRHAGIQLRGGGDALGQDRQRQRSAGPATGVVLRAGSAGKRAVEWGPGAWKNGLAPHGRLSCSR